MYTKLNYFDFFSVQFFSLKIVQINLRLRNNFLSNVQKNWNYCYRSQIVLLANPLEMAPFWNQGFTSIFVSTSENVLPKKTFLDENEILLYKLWKVRKFTLPHFLQEFREIRQNIFRRERISRFFTMQCSVQTLEYFVKKGLSFVRFWAFL